MTLEIFTGKLQATTGTASICDPPIQSYDMRIHSLLKLLDLTPVVDQYSDTYSGGNKRRLSLAIACIKHPQVMFLDDK
ncbi:hypothetical protein BDF19DRAFT_421813 [Syncephalis fuscata]|nr:hypothetical protein BDF19DRAFT_421813 [Syncephalis fuscata]